MDSERPNNHLEQAVLATVVYFDMFDYPLTAEEIWQNLYFEKGVGEKKHNLEDTKNTLETNEYLQSKISFQDGLYFLRGRNNILQIRHERHLISQPKWKRAYWVTKFLKMSPFVRFIAVCNSISYYNAEDDSDIDLFIITKPGRIWTSRLFITIITSLLGVRRYGNKIRDRICLSFYVSEKGMDLSRLSDLNPDTHYLFWITQIAPVFRVDDVEKRFWNTNKWIREYLPNHIPFKGVDYQRTVTDGVVSQALRKSVEKLLSRKVGDAIEKGLKNMQLKKMSAKADSARWENNKNVIVNDDVLKFHERDARKKWRQRFLHHFNNISN